MDHTVTFYQNCIKHLLSEYESLRTEETDIELIFDDERQRYLVMRVGWVHHKRIHLCLVHIELRNNTIIIQANNTEEQLDDELVEMGIPREDIRLGLLPTDVQEYAARQYRERQQMLHATQEELRESARQCA